MRKEVSNTSQPIEEEKIVAKQEEYQSLSNHYKALNIDV